MKLFVSSGLLPEFNLVFSVEDSLAFTLFCAPVGVSAPIPLVVTCPEPALLSVPSAFIDISLFLILLGIALAVLYAVPPSKLNWKSVSSIRISKSPWLMLLKSPGINTVFTSPAVIVFVPPKVDS